MNSNISHLVNGDVTTLRHSPAMTRHGVLLLAEWDRLSF